MTKDLSYNLNGGALADGLKYRFNPLRVLEGTLQHPFPWG